MAFRGYVSSSLSGKPVQAPGMMRHGPFPGYSPSGLHPLEPVSHAEVLEKKIMTQEAEMDSLTMENRRLAATHAALRQELVASQHELQRIHAHVGSIHNENDNQIRGLLEKISKAEADIYASEDVRKELQKVNLEGQRLLAERQELTTEIQRLTEGLQKAKADIKNLPELHTELEGLRQEHKNLRSAFEYEKNLNKEQVEQMCGMEKNLITMAKEVDKLRADILQIEKTAQAPVYPSVGQVLVHNPDQGYSQGAGYAENANAVAISYPNSGYSHGGFSGYVPGYGMVSTTQMAGAAAVQGGNVYSTVGSVYPNGSIISLVPVAGGMQQAVDGTNTSTGVITAAYDGASVGLPPLPPGPPPPSATGWR
ncbi:protein FLX-like 2 [Phalaenopsis equestris]|uniref:protein FLX-like 2 n=1 Tax=Phalaenopsis equestris TaxID=78828 RepID=UPI0009E356FF|nr:protein FLX-like 2 [Phalaenopsis equestris]XP_020577973.1 protein FLX-like 2 [Phalaenopsis equestris]XP_020577974.1 protein FLX-like 2 [Phalaenopsis equestris]XP_020577975.1 protein FLX-like 2 [Phalaenopsis equestris]XP_020577976.1 protein FLX-like 2 [Phalaenopsis equestris]XP_020577977.1 protein FLX-like 2 [Phalaenopsis equestris]